MRAVRARTRDDVADWRLLYRVSTALHNYGVHWAAALAEDLPAAQACPAVEMVAV